MSEALLKARKILGSNVKLAKAIGASEGMVNAWINKGVKVPLEFALEIDRVTGGLVHWTEVAPQFAHYQKRWEACDLMLHRVCFRPVNITLSRIKHEEGMENTDDIQEIANSILQHGIDRPIGVDEENNLIFGIGRLEAYRWLDKTTIPSWRLSLGDLIEGKYSPVIIQYTFQLSERVAIGLALEKHLGERRGKSKGKYDIEFRRTNEVIAEVLGFGNRESYAQAKKVYRQGTTALIARMDAQALSISAAAGLSTLPFDDQNDVLALPKNSITALIRSLPKVTHHLPVESAA